MVQRFKIGTPSSSPGAAAATGFDDSDISSIERDEETESTTSMPDITCLVIVGAVASGSAGLGSSAAAPPWVGSSSAPSAAAAEGVLQVQGLKRTYADVRDVAPGWACQRSALLAPAPNPICN